MMVWPEAALYKLLQYTLYIRVQHCQSLDSTNCTYIEADSIVHVLVKYYNAGVFLTAFVQFSW